MFQRSGFGKTWRLLLPENESDVSPQRRLFGRRSWSHFHAARRWSNCRVRPGHSEVRFVTTFAQIADDTTILVEVANTDFGDCNAVVVGRFQNVIRTRHSPGLAVGPAPA